jgi:hypothetical protein
LSVPEYIAAPDVCDGTSAVGESRHRIPRRIRKAGWRPFQHKLPLFRLVVICLFFLI